MGRFDKYVTGEGFDSSAQPQAPASEASPVSRFQKYITGGDETRTPRPRGFNEPFGELRPADYTYSQRIGNAAQDAMIAAGASPYSAGRITGALGDLTRINPVTGAIPAAMDAGYYATASDLPFTQRAMKTGVEALSMLPGYRVGARVARGMPQRAISPTGEELGAATDLGYQTLRNSPTRFSPDMAKDVRNEITVALANRNPEDKKRALSALDDFVNRSSQTGLSPNDFENLRQSMKGGNTPAEIASGQRALETLDNYMRNPPRQHIRVGSPAQIADDEAVRNYARGNAATGFRNDTLADIARNAEIKEARGKDAGKYVQDKLDSLLTTKTGERKTAGYTADETQQIRDALTQTLTEKAGNALVSPWTHGLLAPITGGGIVKGAMAGLDPLTMAVAGSGIQGGMAATGAALKGMSSARAQNALTSLGENIRMRSPLAQSVPERFGYVTDPDVMVRDAQQYLLAPFAREKAQETIDQEMVPYERR